MESLQEIKDKLKKVANAWTEINSLSVGLRASGGIYLRRPGRLVPVHNGDHQLNALHGICHMLHLLSNRARSVRVVIDNDVIPRRRDPCRLCRLLRSGGRGPALVHQSQHLDGDERSHGHHGHTAEGVGEHIASHRLTGPHGKGEQEGGGHGAGGHAA